MGTIYLAMKSKLKKIMKEMGGDVVFQIGMNSDGDSEILAVQKDFEWDTGQNREKKIKKDKLNYFG